MILNSKKEYSTGDLKKQVILLMVLF